MHLTEPTSIAASALPIADLRAHLRIGTGFADDTLQDGLLTAALKAALQTIERQTGRALINRKFLLRLHRWHRPDRQSLPRAPVTEISEIAIRRPNGERITVDPGRFRLAVDDHGSTIRAAGLFPSLSRGAAAEIGFMAGYGPDWADIPGDLALATVILAAARYEDRSGNVGIPAAVSSLIAPYRTLRVSRSA